MRTEPSVERRRDADGSALSGGTGVSGDAEALGHNPF